MTVSIQQINTATDSFGQWVYKSNLAFGALTNVAVTTNSNTTVGNAAITGVFSANGLSATSNVKVGTGTSNIVMNAQSIVVRTSTSNLIISSSGLLLGSTAYYQNYISLGNTIITTANVKSDSGFFANFRLGNATAAYVTMDSTGFSSAKINTNNIVVTGPNQKASIGTIEANVYITKDALEVYSNPSGSAVQNSKLTSTDLWVKRIHAEELFVDSTSGGNGGTNASDITVNNIYGNPLINMRSNTYFYQNSFFVKGLFSNCNVGIGNNFITPETCLHVRPSIAVVSTDPVYSGLTVLGVNSKSNILLESNTTALIEFRSSVNSNTQNGMIFVDDNQAGYLVYKHGASSGSGVGDRLRLGAFGDISLEVGGGVLTHRDGVQPGKREVMQVSNTALTLNDASMVFKGSTSGQVALKANAVSGSVTFTLPAEPGQSGQAMLTDGTGKLYFGSVASGGTAAAATPTASTLVVKGKIPLASGTVYPWGVGGSVRAIEVPKNVGDWIIPFQDDDDPNNWHNGNKFQPNKAGYYNIHGHVFVWHYATFSEDYSYHDLNIQIIKNGSERLTCDLLWDDLNDDRNGAGTYSGQPQNNDRRIMLKATTLVYMNGTSDYVEFKMWNTHTSRLMISYHGDNTTGTNENGASILFSRYHAYLVTSGGGSGAATLDPASYARIAGLGVGVDYNPPTAGFGEIRAGGNITAYYSDERLKENITPLTGSLLKVTQLRGVTFNSNDVAEQNGYLDKSRQVGVIAQDVVKVLPEAVKLAPFDTIYDDEQNEISKSGENYLTVQYDKIVPLLIEAIKDLKQEIEDLKSSSCKCSGK